MSDSDYSELEYEIGPEGRLLNDILEPASRARPSRHHKVQPPVHLDEGTYKLRVPLDVAEGVPVRVIVEGGRLLVDPTV